MRKVLLFLAIFAIVFIGVFLFYRNFYRTSGTEVSSAGGESFAGVSLRLEYALTEAERERGLGGRTSLAPDAAMLFVFLKDGLYGFWMKDTLIPLDMFWLDQTGKVVSIKENALPGSFPSVFYSLAPARYVLETVAGFASKHSVATGTPLLLQSWPTVSE